MGSLQKILLVILVLFLILVALVFSMNNQMAVSLNFLFFETAPHGIAIWLILAFVLGAVVGIILTSLALVQRAISRKQLQKRLDRAESALEKNRNAEDRAL